MSIQTNRQDIRKINSYRDAEQYILNIPKFTGKNCMEDTGRFLEHLGNPSVDKKIIHVAGTNGKGSVCAYLCSVMRAAGISCAMFISPHLVTMRERFVIDGEMISEEKGVEYIVLETGLGGRLDATNAVDRKALSVITSIGYGHMEYPGNTLPEIAVEKAGIMRRGIPAVCSVRQPEAAHAIEQYAGKVGQNTSPLLTLR